MKGNQNSEKYMEIILQRALPIIKLQIGNDFIFQQDNCPIHVSKNSISAFQKADILLLDWPPYSPDINIVENIWSILSNLVYCDGPAKNLKNLEELIRKSVIIFNEEKRNQVFNLYNSMRKRLCDITQKKGDRIKY